jgi:enoyl-CoA hydratase/carnithine racemase
MTDGLTFHQDGAVARLTIDRPDAGNMLTLAMVSELADMVAGAGADGATRAIVLSGAGDDFCRGRDPAGAPENAPTTALEMRSRLIEPILGAYRAIQDAPVPVIAVVQGLANGLGCGLAAVCDVTIAADDARFALPEMRANLPPTLAMLANIDRIPGKSLLWMVYSTGEIDARRALDHGLVSQLAPAAELDAVAEEFITGLIGRNREAIVTCKRYLGHARLMDPAAAHDLAGNMLSVVLASK